jgi:hypothetical protein
MNGHRRQQSGFPFVEEEPGQTVTVDGVGEECVCLVEGRVGEQQVLNAVVRNMLVSKETQPPCIVRHSMHTVRTTEIAFDSTSLLGSSEYT